MICPKCGSDNDDSETYCVKCGHELLGIPPEPGAPDDISEISWPEEDEDDEVEYETGGEDVDYDDDDDLPGGEEDDSGVEFDDAPGFGGVDEDDGDDSGVEFDDGPDSGDGYEEEADYPDDEESEVDYDEEDDGGDVGDEGDHEEEGEEGDEEDGEEDALPPPPDDFEDDDDGVDEDEEDVDDDHDDDGEEEEYDDDEVDYEDDEDEEDEEEEEDEEDEEDEELGIEYEDEEDGEGDEPGPEDEEADIAYDDDEADDEVGIEYDEEDEEEGDDIDYEEGTDEVTLEDDHMFLGRTAKESVQLPTSTLKRHFVALGASGSGKTVFGKCILEEATRNGIPSIVMDPQGDLASLILISSEEECERHDIPLQILEDYREKAEVRIFTPASSRGIPLCINPLKTFPPDFSPEDVIRALDTVSNSIASLLGYKTDSDSGKAAASYLYHVLEVAWRSRTEVEDFRTLAKVVDKPETMDIEDSSAIIKKKEREKLARKLRHLSMGLEKLLFSFGFPLDIDELFTPIEEGKVPINIIYLNTLSSEAHKQFFIAVVGNELYSWMLTHPAKEVQALFYIDEVAPYLPPHPFNPPAKSILKLLFKQARKYGVSCMMCTQNPADVDYKALAQANTWALGRMMTPQDLKKVSGMLKAISASEAEGILDRLPVLQAGEFILLCPDVYDKAQQMNVRWLVTEHETLEAEMLKEELPEEILAYFDKRSKTMAALKTKKKVEPVESEPEPEEEVPEEEDAPEPVKEPEEKPEPEIKPCRKCGKPLKPAATFCTKCGTPVKEKKKGKACPKCGKKLRPTAIFCTGCGKKLEEPKAKPGKKAPSRAKKAPSKAKKKFCTGCGKTLKPGATFCTKCGKKFGKK